MRWKQMLFTTHILTDSRERYQETFVREPVLEVQNRPKFPLKKMYGGQFDLGVKLFKI